MGLRFGFASLRYDMSMKCRVPAVLMVTLLAMLTAPVFAGKPPALYSFRTDGVRPGGLFAIWSPEPFIPVDKLRYPPFALAGENGQTIALSSRTLAGTRGNRDDMLRGVFLEVPADCPAGKYDLLCADKPTGFPVTILPAAPMEPIIKISPTDGDDAAALNKILEENKDKHATILFSPGVYRWKSQIKLPPATTLTADCQGPVHIVCSVPTPETWSIQLTAATDYGKISNLIFHGDPLVREHSLIRAQVRCSGFEIENCVFEDFSQVAINLTGTRYWRCRAVRTAMVLENSLALDCRCEEVNPRYHAFVIAGKGPSLMVQCFGLGTDRGIILRAGVHGTKINSVQFRDIVSVGNGCEGILAEDASVDDVSIDHIMYTNCLSSVIMVWCNDNNGPSNVSGWRVNDIRTIGGIGSIYLRPNATSWITDMRFTNVELDGWIRLDKGCQGIVFDGLLQRPKFGMENQEIVTFAAQQLKTNTEGFINNGTGTVVRKRVVDSPSTQPWPGK